MFLSLHVSLPCMKRVESHGGSPLCLLPDSTEGDGLREEQPRWFRLSAVAQESHTRLRDRGYQVDRRCPNIQASLGATPTSGRAAPLSRSLPLAFRAPSHSKLRSRYQPTLVCQCYCHFMIRASSGAKQGQPLKVWAAFGFGRPGSSGWETRGPPRSATRVKTSRVSEGGGRINWRSRLRLLVKLSPAS